MVRTERMLSSSDDYGAKFVIPELQRIRMDASLKSFGSSGWGVWMNMSLNVFHELKLDSPKTPKIDGTIDVWIAPWRSYTAVLIELLQSPAFADLNAEEILLMIARGKCSGELLGWAP